MFIYIYTDTHTYNIDISLTTDCKTSGVKDGAADLNGPQEPLAEA